MTFKKLITRSSMPQFWIGDHILMLIAISLWLAGLAASKTYMARNNKTADFGAGMIFVALAVWILILASELTILPILGNKGTDVKVWEAVFSFGLLSGYFGFACSWIGIFCYGMTMKQAGGTFPKWFSALPDGPVCSPFSASSSRVCILTSAIS